MTASATVAPPTSSTSPATPLVGDTPLSFPQVCARIHDRIYTFLDETDVTPRLKGVQEQTRVALAVIEEALDRYR